MVVSQLAVLLNRISKYTNGDGPMAATKYIEYSSCDVCGDKVIITHSDATSDATPHMCLKICVDDCNSTYPYKPVKRSTNKFIKDKMNRNLPKWKRK